jgi:hypothetical protein
MAAGPVLILSFRPVMTGAEAGYIAQALRTCTALDAVVIDGRGMAAQETGETGPDKGRDGEHTRPPSHAGRLVKRTGLGWLVGGAKKAIRMIVYFNRRKSYFRDLFEKIRPIAILAFDDRLLKTDGVALRVGQKMSIPASLACYAASSVESDVSLRRNKASHNLDAGYRKFFKHLFISLFPRQVHKTAQGGTLTFYTPLETLVLFALGVLPKSPWHWGASGFVDRIFALSDSHADYVASGGVERARIAVTGQASFDALALAPDARLALRHRLMEEYGLPGHAPLAICAVPQYAEHRMLNWDDHWALTDELFETLGKSRFSFILSLHPKSNRSSYEQVAERHGLHVADTRMFEILPAADLLVATFSSTVAWASQLAIPSIVVDATNLNYRIYDNVAGIHVLNDHASLAELLRAWADPAALQAAKTAAHQSRETFGRLDGHASRRMAEHIADLVQRDRVAGPVFPSPPRENLAGNETDRPA